MCNGETINACVKYLSHVGSVSKQKQATVDDGNLKHAT